MNDSNSIKKDSRFIQYLISIITKQKFKRKKIIGSKYYIGSLSEIYHKFFSYYFKEGLWDIYELNFNSYPIVYAQYNSDIYAESKTSSIKKINIVPKFERETISTSVYGFIDINSLTSITKSLNIMNTTSTDNLDSYIIDKISKMSFVESNEKLPILLYKFNNLKHTNIIIYISKENNYLVNILFIPSRIINFYYLDYTKNNYISDTKELVLRNIIHQPYLNTCDLINKDIKYDKNYTRINIIVEFLKKYYNDLPIYLNTSNKKYFIGTLEEYYISYVKNNFSYILSDGPWSIYQYHDSLHKYNNDHILLKNTPNPNTEKIVYGELNSLKHSFLNLHRITQTDVYFTNIFSKITPDTLYTTSCNNNHYIFLSFQNQSSQQNIINSFLIIPCIWFDKYLNIEHNFLSKIEDSKLLSNVTFSKNSIEIIKKQHNKNLLELLKQEKYRLPSTTFNVEKNNKYYIGSAEVMIKKDFNNPDQIYEFKTGVWKIMHRDILLIVHTKYKYQELEYEFCTKKTYNIGFADVNTLQHLIKTKLVMKNSTIITQPDYSDKYYVYIATNTYDEVLCCVFIPEKLLSPYKLRDSTGNFCLKSSDSDS